MGGTSSTSAPATDAQLLLLGDADVVGEYCAWARRASRGAVDPNEFVGAVVRAAPKAVGAVVDAGPVFWGLDVGTRFGLLTRALKLAPSVRHIVGLEALLGALGEGQLAQLLALITPRTLTFSCISMINAGTKHDLYDLYVKARIAHAVTSGRLVDAGALVAEFDDPLFSAAQALQYLVARGERRLGLALLARLGLRGAAVAVLAGRGDATGDAGAAELLRGLSPAEVAEVVAAPGVAARLLARVYANAAFEAAVGPDIGRALHAAYFREQAAQMGVPAGEVDAFVARYVGRLGSSGRLHTLEGNTTQVNICCGHGHRYRSLAALAQRVQNAVRRLHDAGAGDAAARVSASFEGFIDGLKRGADGAGLRLVCPRCAVRGLDQTTPQSSA